VLFVTALAVAVLGLDVVPALGAAVHAVSTAGPVRALDGTVLDPSAWPAPARLALLPAMVIGRLSIYPALVALSAGVAVCRNRIRLARRIRSYRGRTL
jgi:Trk-type K+ transport system membrane component